MAVQERPHHGLPPVIEPGHSFGTVTDKIASIVQTPTTHWGWIVGFGLSTLFKDLHLVDGNRAFLVLAAVALIDTLLLYRFFTVQLPQYKRIEALSAANDASDAGGRRPVPGRARRRSSGLTRPW